MRAPESHVPAYMINISHTVHGGSSIHRACMCGYVCRKSYKYLVSPMGSGIVTVLSLVGVYHSCRTKHAKREKLELPWMTVIQ